MVRCQELTGNLHKPLILVSYQVVKGLIPKPFSRKLKPLAWLYKRNSPYASLRNLFLLIPPVNEFLGTCLQLCVLKFFGTFLRI